MVRRTVRAVVGLTALAFTASVFALPAGAATPRQQQGVNKDSIDIVAIVPDLDTLRARGINVGTQTTDDFVKQFTSFTDAFGPINGRKVNVIKVGWDPLDATTSFDKACIAATQDNKPFVVVNGSGFQTSSIPCVSVDNKTPYFSGDMVYNGLQKASGKNLVSIALPAEVSAAGAVDLINKTKSIPKTGKIGILSSNVPSIDAATKTLVKEFKKKGYSEPTVVQINGLAADASVLGRETTAAASTFQTAGVDNVFIPQSWTSVTGFLTEADKTGYKPKLWAIDGQANTCTPFAPTRTNPLAAGATCVTAWDGRSVPTRDGIKKDSAFEAKCRATYEQGSGKKTLPGGSSGPFTANGVTYDGEMPTTQCMMMNVLLPAMKKAGKNLTWDKVHANLLATTEAPTVYMSNGKGGFAKNKPYLADPVMHFTEMLGATASTPQDPTTKLFNGCAIPAPCYGSTIVDGKDWYQVSTGAAASG